MANVNREKYILQRRATLKAQLTIVTRGIAENRWDIDNIRLRFERLMDLFHTYEELHDELAVISPDADQSHEFMEVQDKYYELATKVKSFSESQASTSSTADLNMSSMSIDKTRRIKLPVAELPKFEGRLEDWLSYKNTFLTMINSRDDISELQKFLYLKNSLQGEALTKISIFNVSAENYKVAWNLLTESYEKKRILIANHLDAILDMPVLTKATHKDLIKLVDNLRQHVNMLHSLNVKPDEHLLIRVLERALPHNTRSKWEESLNLDTVPTLEQLYTFINETAFRILTLEQRGLSLKRNQPNGNPLNNKLQKNNHGARALVHVTNALSNCVMCKTEAHALYRCPAFGKLSVSSRWDFVKGNNLCKNCLRKHGGICNAGKCKTCQRSHNTLLHNSRSTYAGSNRNGVKDSSIRPVTTDQNVTKENSKNA